MTRRVLIASVLVLGLAVEAAGGQPVAPPRAGGERLEALWKAYRERYILPTGAVIDPSRESRVSSEAQSYALLRAVWMRDRATFERVIAWTDAHLRRSDGMHAWLWDPAQSRVIDSNTATDGDIDIAYALAMASVVFDRPAYAAQARAIVRAIRTGASVPVAGGWVPSAGNWAAPERIVNLSYFYPYVAPWFERLDPGVGWDRSVETGYGLVEQALAAGPMALPADFNVLMPDGALRPLPAGHALSALFSYDAIRISWRLEMACRLSRDRRGCRVSDALVTRLAAVLRRDGRLVTQYAVDGTARNTEESTSFYAAFLPAFTRVAPATAREWRRTHLGEEALDALMRADARYYDANWAWFGLAAADGFLEARTPEVGQLKVDGR